MSIKVGGLTAYTVEELSEMLGVHPKTIRAMLHDGKLKGRKLARRWYVTDEALKEYFKTEEQTNGED